MDQEVLVKGLKDGSLSVAHCALCKGPADHLSLMLPSDTTAKRIGEPKGHVRMAVFGLCDLCIETHGEEGVARRMDEVLVKQLGVQ